MHTPNLRTASSFSNERAEHLDRFVKHFDAFIMRVISTNQGGQIIF